jgi:hypothetical protein
MNEITQQNATAKKEYRQNDNFEGKQRAEFIWERAFLETLRTHGVVTAACLTANIERSTAYRARERDEGFAKLWDDALDQACDLLEFEAKKRAMQGSDTLLIFLLKAHRPDKYRERLDVNLNLKPPKPYSEMTDAELAEHEAKLRGSIK